MEKSNNTFSQSILDKFRSISKQNEDSSSIASKGTENAEKTESLSAENANGNCSLKRKHSNTEEEWAPGLKECDVGITQYVSTLEGFSGIIKHRFSDFHVNEIDPSGNVVELTSFKIPEDPVEEDKDCDESVLLPENWQSIEEIVNSEEKAPEPVLIDVTDKTKEERTLIHLAIKKKYDSKLISNTKEDDSKKFIKVFKKIKKEGRSEWPKGRGAYLHCAMYKVNKDTTELVHFLSEKLRLKNNLIGYAGTKDKRAKTCQRISFKHKTAEALMGIKMRNVLFGNFSYSDKEIQLGDNKGNRFRIAIRKVSASNESIEANMKTFVENGFINYFGLQRFGNYSLIPTYVIGKALLASDWKLAVELILKPRPSSKRRKELIIAQQTWFKDRDAVAAVKWLPRFDNSLEAKILRTLKAQGNNAFMNALTALPRHTMTMYLHSYQSLIWNQIVSRRIEKFGLKPLPGDLLAVGEEFSQDSDSVLADEFNDENDEEEAAEQDPSDSSDGDKRKKNKRKIKVREISEDEVDSVSILDIVYPLPGHDILYPNNEVKNWYLEILNESNFSLDDFNNTHKSFALGGAYRRIIAKPSNLSWYVVHTDSIDQDLILSDDDKLNGVTLPEFSQEGLHKSVVVAFNLDSCSYATMALREIMKCDTSSYYHSQLTEQTRNASSEQTKREKLDV